ncbi:hypothetical protein INR49_002089, partial [Caranx melampygus]
MEMTKKMMVVVMRCWLTSESMQLLQLKLLLCNRKTKLHLNQRWIPTLLLLQVNQLLSVKQYCAGYGGNLASVHDIWQYNFLQRLVRNGGHAFAWIGGYHFEDDWRWADGSRFDYQNWEVTSPTDIYKCLQLNTEAVSVTPMADTDSITHGEQEPAISIGSPGVTTKFILWKMRKSAAAVLLHSFFRKSSEKELDGRLVCRSMKGISAAAVCSVDSETKEQKRDRGPHSQRPDGLLPVYTFKVALRWLWTAAAAATTEGSCEGAANNMAYSRAYCHPRGCRRHLRHEAWPLGLSGSWGHGGRRTGFSLRLKILHTRCCEMFPRDSLDVPMRLRECPHETLYMTHHQPSRSPVTLAVRGRVFTWQELSDCGFLSP